MIIDTLDNLEKYVSLNPLFKDVVDFLKSNDLNNLEPGKHLIKDTDVFVNVQTAKSKTRSEAVFEYHRKYVDIQFDNRKALLNALLLFIQGTCLMMISTYWFAVQVLFS